MPGEEEYDVAKTKPKLHTPSELVDDFVALLDLQPLSTVALPSGSVAIHCEKVGGQGEACQVPHQSELPEELKGMYIRADVGGKGYHWGKRRLIELTLKIAYAWWKEGNKPICLVSHLSAKRFKGTTGHKSHKTGEDADFDLAKTLPKDGNWTAKKQKKCLRFVTICLQAGASRVLFSDEATVKAANVIAKREGWAGRARVDADHDNHFHVDL